VEGLPFAGLGAEIFEPNGNVTTELFPPYRVLRDGGGQGPVIRAGVPLYADCNPAGMFSPILRLAIRDERMQENG